MTIDLILFQNGEQITIDDKLNKDNHKTTEQNRMPVPAPGI